MKILLVVYLVVVTPEGGIATKTDHILHASAANCEKSRGRLIQALTWVKQRRDGKGRIQSTVAYSIAKAVCIQVAGDAAEALK